MNKYVAYHESKDAIVHSDCRSKAVLHIFFINSRLMCFVFLVKILLILELFTLLAPTNLFQENASLEPCGKFMKTLLCHSFSRAINIRKR